MRAADWIKASVLLMVDCVTLCGCASISAPSTMRPPQPLPAELQQYYSFQPITAPPLVRHTKNHSDYTVRELALTPPESPSEPIQLLWFAPATLRPSPLILISPISGSNRLIVDDFARRFAINGYHAVIVSKPKRHKNPEAPLAYFEEFLRAAVIRNRQTLDWLVKQPGIDPARIGTMGVSYGAIINAATAAVEPRARCHLFALGGGPLHDVIMDSVEPGLRRDRQRARAQENLTRRELHRQLRAIIRTDPVLLAKYVDGKEVLMVIALFDRSVGTDNSLALWHALGRPEAMFVPLGHYTTFLELPYLKFRAMEFFHEKLGGPPLAGNLGFIYTRPTAKSATETPAAPSP